MCVCIISDKPHNCLLFPFPYSIALCVFTFLLNYFKTTVESAAGVYVERGNEIDGKMNIPLKYEIDTEWGEKKMTPVKTKPGRVNSKKEEELLSYQ